MADRTLYLGDEFDDDLRSALSDVLEASGAKSQESNWAVGGSQLLESLVLEISGRRIRMEAETYMGLSLTGDDDLVSQIARDVAVALEARKRAATPSQAGARSLPLQRGG